jgi:peptidoglycan lytic transglycosylase
MRRLIIGCGVATLVALTAKPEAQPPVSFVKFPLGHMGAQRRATPPAEFRIYPLPKGELGVASWYGDETLGVTASGEVFDDQELTAAHRTLPLGSKIEVTNLSNNRSLVLRVNDRGPNVSGRLVDVSRSAAERLGFAGSGRTAVRVRVLSFPKQYLAWLRKAPMLCIPPAR